MYGVPSKTESLQSAQVGLTPKHCAGRIYSISFLLRIECGSSCKFIVIVPSEGRLTALRRTCPKVVVSRCIRAHSQGPDSIERLGSGDGSGGGFDGGWQKRRTGQRCRRGAAQGMCIRIRRRRGHRHAHAYGKELGAHSFARRMTRLLIATRKKNTRTHNKYIHTHTHIYTHTHTSSRWHLAGPSRRPATSTAPARPLGEYPVTTCAISGGLTES